MPILVGGAALSQNFTDHRIAPAYGGLVVYAKDAMSGLDLANRLLSGDEARERARRGVAEAAARPIAARRRSDQEIPLAAPAVRSAEVAVVEAAARAATRAARPAPCSLSRRSGRT